MFIRVSFLFTIAYIHPPSVLRVSFRYGSGDGARNLPVTSEPSLPHGPHAAVVMAVEKSEVGKSLLQ